MAETAGYSAKSVYLTPGHAAGMHFSASSASGEDYGTVCWVMKCQQKGHKQP